MSLDISCCECTAGRFGESRPSPPHEESVQRILAGGHSLDDRIDRQLTRSTDNRVSRHAVSPHEHLGFVDTALHGRGVIAARVDPMAVHEALQSLDGSIGKGFLKFASGPRLECQGGLTHTGQRSRRTGEEETPQPRYRDLLRLFNHLRRQLKAPLQFTIEGRSEGAPTEGQECSLGVPHLEIAISNRAWTPSGQRRSAPTRGRLLSETIVEGSEGGGVKHPSA